MAEEPAETSRVKRLKERLDTGARPDILAHLARAVLGSDDPHISHTEALAQLPSYVADEIAGLSVSELYAEIKRHFDLCAECEAEYLELLHLAQMEEAGELSAPAAIPEADLSFLPQKVSLVSYVRTLSKDLVTIIRPNTLPSFEAIADTFFKWIERQGGRLILVRADLREALGINEDAMSDVALILTATQLTTQSLIDTLTPEDVQMKAVGDSLQQRVLEHAERSAIKVGLDSDAAHEFAQQYAERIIHDADTLQELITSRST